MSVHVDDVIMASKPETLKVIKENIKDKFNISESRKVKKFLRFYYKWGYDEKGTYAKINMDKDAKKLVEGYEKYSGSDLRIQKTPGSPGTTLSKSDLKDTNNINKYR